MTLQVADTEQQLLREFEELIRRIGHDVSEQALAPVVADLLKDWRQDVIRFNDQVRGTVDDFAAQLQAMTAEVDERVGTVIDEGQQEFAAHTASLREDLDDALRSILQCVSASLDASLAQAQASLAETLAQSDVPSHLHKLSEGLDTLDTSHNLLIELKDDTDTAVRDLHDRAMEALEDVDRRLPSLHEELARLNAHLTRWEELQTALHKSAASFTELQEPLITGLDQTRDAITQLSERLAQQHAETQNLLSSQSQELVELKHWLGGLAALCGVTLLGLGSVVWILLRR
jgi:chromosome segregation ATPase